MMAGAPTPNESVLREQRQHVLDKLSTARQVLEALHEGQQAWSSFVVYGEEEDAAPGAVAPPFTLEMGKAFINATSALTRLRDAIHDEHSAIVSTMERAGIKPAPAPWAGGL